ncbi:hypothetical protein VHEMI04024 [[Torrubiella] hemipterigena]|uniref:Alpha-1,2-mannosyltransferase n=1 Tax=[Torrubiella] hemipterigena TaxID=1531966 RepID=A0A0A1SU51_9HYPO|nr:hypothetical protein VHEMI04024 [[Torrubiella] hemipterigena]
MDFRLEMLYFPGLKWEILLCICAGFLVVFYNLCKQYLQPNRYQNPEKETKHSRDKPHGEFKMPVPPAYPGWSLKTTKPLPYRAFRYGPKYNVTMGLRVVAPIDWIELDNQFPKFHADKAARIIERGEQCIKTHEEAFSAAVELLEELTEYLPARYPSLYQKTATGIRNLWSGESFNIQGRLLQEDPMVICSRLVQDDLALMIEQPDGQYRLLAGSILLAGFWRLSDKFGMTLSDIHTSGHVPHFHEKLEGGMLKFFQRLKCDKFYARNNYFIQVDESLPWSYSIGDEDSPALSWSTAEKNKAIEHHWFRSERQTLRRLPKTKAICFTIRTYFHPITDIVKEDHVPGRLASAVRSWDDWVAEYKGREKYEQVLLEYLDRKHKEQLCDGLGPVSEDTTEGYPW